MKVSDDMRRAIDAAVAGGKVTVIPPAHVAQPAVPRRALDKHNTKLQVRAAKALKKVKDTRRGKITSVPTGKVRSAVKGYTGSIFPNMVRDVDLNEVVLKGGENNAKIGGMVLVGALKGARIVSLALEERATCPTSCALWEGCYTNNMQRMIRYRHGDALNIKIALELEQLCRDHEKVLVRLHVSGDFYSLDYLAFWKHLLNRHKGLHIFGFTAWGDETPIGSVIALLREKMPERFAVRTSGRTGKWGSFTLPFPTERKMIGDAVVCPEQQDAMSGHQNLTHCGSCGMCWKVGGGTGRPVCFIEH